RARPLEHHGLNIADLDALPFRRGQLMVADQEWRHGGGSEKLPTGQIATSHFHCLSPVADWGIHAMEIVAHPVPHAVTLREKIQMKYKSVVQTILAIGLVASLPLTAAGPKVTVYKTSTCGCCGKWVEHLKTNGFDVTVQDVPSTDEYR